MAVAERSRRELSVDAALAVRARHTIEEISFEVCPRGRIESPCVSRGRRPLSLSRKSASKFVQGGVLNHLACHAAATPFVIEEISFEVCPRGRVESSCVSCGRGPFRVAWSVGRPGAERRGHQQRTPFLVFFFGCTYIPWIHSWCFCCCKWWGMVLIDASGPLYRSLAYWYYCAVHVLCFAFFHRERRFYRLFCVLWTRAIDSEKMS